MLTALSELIERRIEEATRAGAFDDLPGAGRPLELDDDSFVPEEMRAGFRVLKNAGLMPRELEQLLQRRGTHRRLHIDPMQDGTADSDDEAFHARLSGRASDQQPTPHTRPPAPLDVRSAAGRMQAFATLMETRGLSLATGVGREYRDRLLLRIARLVRY